MTAHTIDDVTCLGCGCACDDIRVVVEGARITDARNACPLGREWFGDGAVPATIRVDGTLVPPGEAATGASIDSAINAAASLLADSVRPLVSLAPGISCETQREAAAIADLLHARLDSVTSATARPLVIAAQERGFASATFGEIRNRADVIVFWAVDVAHRYPRFETRYASDRDGSHLGGASNGRRAIGVDVGAAVSSAAYIDHRVSVSADDELAVLTALQALVREPASDTPLSTLVDGASAWTTARELAGVLRSGRYVALVFDGEPDDRENRSLQRFDAILALSQALNQRARCAAIALRAGGNRSGADVVLTAQTGYPMGIDFSRGYPRYDVFADSISTHDVALIVGDTSSLPRPVLDSLARSRAIVIGPRASRTPLGEVAICIDTGVAGIHSTGTAFRADDVPLGLRAPLAGRLSAAEVVRSLAQHVAAALRASPAPAR